MKYQNTWDLDVIFPGGTKSPELQKKLTSVKEGIGEYQKLIQEWNAVEEKAADPLKEILEKFDIVENGLGQCYVFVQMCHDAYTNDEYANVVMGQVMDLVGQLENGTTVFKKKLVSIPDDIWKSLFNDPELNEVSFSLNEMRDQAKRLLSEEEEKIITDLNKDGLAAWNKIYGTVVSIMKIPFTDKDGKTIEYSVGQAMNRMYDDPDAEVRKQLFENWEAAWSKFGPIFADILNHLDGYRITLQKAHHREHFLDEPLEDNRMSKETLDAMWNAISNHKSTFVKYLSQKAKILGMDKLGWQDVEAPIVLGNSEPPRLSYDEACDFILDNFSSFGTKLTAFAKHALENRWVEAEDRPNKRPGGYCAGVPEFKESRIFMTFMGSPSGASTLAHELGHAFHSYAMKDMPALNRRYAMNVAETASTFAETIVGNATVKNAKTKEEKITLLDTKMQNAIAMFMNIHARFIFEKAFYEERTEGVVSEQRINELMLNAQKEAYCDSLASYHPHFWCSKLHFFIDDVSFYNFPYTFGFLFGLGIYAESVKNPEGFEDKYIALLRDTGSMKVEDLAMKHLNVDITKQDFWQAGIKLMEKDVEEFISLTNDLVK